MTVERAKGCEGRPASEASVSETCKRIHVPVQ